MLVIFKQRVELDSNAVDGKRRGKSLRQLLLGRRDIRGGGLHPVRVDRVDKPAPLTDRRARTRDLYLEPVKFDALRIESFCVRLVSNQVVALIIQDLPDA